jgi:hypothetical protein
VLSRVVIVFACRSQIGVALPWLFRTFTWPGGYAAYPVDPGFVVRARCLFRHLVWRVFCLVFLWSLPPFFGLSIVSVGSAHSSEWLTNCILLARGSWRARRVARVALLVARAQITLVTCGVMLCIMILVTQTLSWTLHPGLACLAMLFYAWFVIQFCLQSKGVILASC